MSAPSRILVYGVYGAGKSTLAAVLADRLRLPWHPVDDLLWQPGWVEVPVAQQRSRITQICRGERWILDGAYHGWRDVPLARADLVVALDYPRWRSFGRLLRRTLGRLVTGRRSATATASHWGACCPGNRSWCGTSARSAGPGDGCGPGRRIRPGRRCCCSGRRRNWTAGWPPCPGGERAGAAPAPRPVTVVAQDRCRRTGTPCSGWRRPALRGSARAGRSTGDRRSCC